MKYEDNDGVHITNIINKTKCEKHSADIGQACWDVPNDLAGISSYRALCGKRVSASGFNGNVTSTSLRSKSFSKPNRK